MACYRDSFTFFYFKNLFIDSYLKCISQMQSHSCHYVAGQILNRFTKDMGAIDEMLPQTMMDCLQVAILTSLHDTEFVHCTGSLV
jgi:hypothetical protein